MPKGIPHSEEWNQRISKGVRSHGPRPWSNEAKQHYTLMRSLPIPSTFAEDWKTMTYKELFKKYDIGNVTVWKWAKKLNLGKKPQKEIRGKIKDKIFTEEEKKYFRDNCLIPLTHGKFAIVDPEDYDRVNILGWHAYNKNTNWYATTATPDHNRKSGARSLKMHRYILGLNKNEQCDHINGNGLDNRKINLRVVTPSQNRRNSKKQRKTSSKYKGVCWKIPNCKWVCNFAFEGKRIWLGSFNSEIQAAKAYNRAAIKYFGEYARINDFTKEPGATISLLDETNSVEVNE